jgi:hypothetical protein
VVVEGWGYPALTLLAAMATVPLALLLVAHLKANESVPSGLS